MEATNNGQTFTYSLPKASPSGGYTWLNFKKANPHLEVAGLNGSDPSNDWVKTTATPAGLVACHGKAQFNLMGAQRIAERCLPRTKQGNRNENGTSEWAGMTWVKGEFLGLRTWFEGVFIQHDKAIGALREDCRSIREDMVNGLDKEKLGETVQMILNRLDAIEAREAARSGVALPTTPRRTWREWLGF